MNDLKQLPRNFWQNYFAGNKIDGVILLFIIIILLQNIFVQSNLFNYYNNKDAGKEDRGGTLPHPVPFSMEGKSALSLTSYL